MYRDPGRIALLAEILVEKHGVLGAQAVAARRARLWNDTDEVADFWRAVGEAVARRRSSGATAALPWRYR